MIRLDKWPGLVTNASPYAVPPGATVEQVNVQCVSPGQLTVRPGMQAVTLSANSGNTSPVARAFRYQSGSSEHIVYQSRSGQIFSSQFIGTAPGSATVPGAPTVSSVTGSTGTLTVTMAAPASNGGSAITGYEFQYRVVGAASWTSAGVSTTVTKVITGLIDGLRYEVRGAATNIAGIGGFSAASGPWVTLIVTPGAPVNVIATPGSAGQVTLTWQAPANDGGTTITGYQFQTAPDESGVWFYTTTAGNVLSFNVTGLGGASKYNFRVAAISSAGTGAYSAPSATVTTASSGSAPTTVGSFTATSGQTSIALSWGLPGSGSSTLVDYIVRYRLSSLPVSQASYWYTLPANRSYTITGLTPSTSYIVEVAGRNLGGVGTFSSLTRTTTS